ncbi:hypothetical protein [Azospirillum argentinense]
MTGGMIFLSVLVVSLLYKLHTSVPGPRGWAWGNILVGVFLLLRMLPAPVPEWLSIAVANGILLLGQGFIYTGMRRFVGLPPLLWLLDDGNARVSAGLLVLSVATVAALVRRDDGGVIGRRLVIGLFAVNAAMLAVRVVLALGSSASMVPNTGGRRHGAGADGRRAVGLPGGPGRREVRERERVSGLLAESERQLSDLVRSSPLPP